MKGQEKGKRSNKFLSALCFATALALLLSALGATLAKYAQRDQNQGVAVAAPFYFTSDILAEDCPYYQIDQLTGSEKQKITFTLSNSVDALRHTNNDDIHFTWRAFSGREVTESSVPFRTGTGELPKGQSETTVEFEVGAGDFTDDVITVEARADTPYEKTISAQYGFTPQQHGLQWTLSPENNGGKSVVVLEIAGGTGGETVTVQWPGELFPDLSNEAFTRTSPQAVTFQPQAGVRYALTFLKPDPSEEVKKEMFTVTTE